MTLAHIDMYLDSRQCLCAFFFFLPTSPPVAVLLGILLAK